MNVKKIIITLLVLTLVMIGCFVSGGIAVTKGTIDIVKDVDFDALLSDFELKDGIETLITYAQNASGGEMVTYNSQYINNPYSVEIAETHGVTESLVIKNFGFNIEIEEAAGTSLSVEFKGKFPASMLGDKVFTYEINADKKELTIEGAEIKNIFNSSVGTVKIKIPAECYKNIEIKNCAGELDIFYLNTEALLIKNFAGEIDGEHVNADELSIYASTGEADLKGSFGRYDIDNCIGKYEFESVSAPEGDSTVSNCIGELEFSMPKNTSLYIIDDSTLSKINCKLEANASGKQFEIHNYVGEIVFEED